MVTGCSGSKLGGGCCQRKIHRVAYLKPGYHKEVLLFMMNEYVERNVMTSVTSNLFVLHTYNSTLKPINTN